MTDESETNGRILARIKAAIESAMAGETSDPAGVPGSRHGSHLAQLAHELKTPLSAIVAAAEIMRDERLGPVGNPRYRGYSADIYESAQHALGVIAAMLAPDARENADGREAPAFVELDINELVRRLASSVRALLAAAGLEIGHALEPGLPHVIADPVTVRQMVLNLVTNAMRATPPGGRIEITTGYDLAGPVCVRIADSGNGMTADEIAAAMDGSREPEQVPRTDGGYGIGYPLVHRLAALNGASINIESESGAGTTVTLSFAPDRVVPV